MTINLLRICMNECILKASLLFIIDGGVYSFAAPLAGWLLDKGIDSVSMLGVGSSVICIGYLVLAPAFPFLDTPSISQIAAGKT